jgi:hypothetical protein
LQRNSGKKNYCIKFNYQKDKRESNIINKSIEIVIDSKKAPVGQLEMKIYAICDVSFERSLQEYAEIRIEIEDKN